MQDRQKQKVAHLKEGLEFCPVAARDCEVPEKVAPTFCAPCGAGTPAVQTPEASSATGQGPQTPWDKKDEAGHKGVVLGALGICGRGSAAVACRRVKKAMSLKTDILTPAFHAAGGASRESR